MGSRFKIRKVTLYHAVLFFIMTLPAFQMLGFDMKFMGSGTPSYIRILSLISFVLSLFLYAAKKLYRRQDIPIILYTLVFFLISMYFYLHHGNVSFSAMLAYVSVFYTVIIFARMDGYLVLDYIYCFFNILDHGILGENNTDKKQLYISYIYIHWTYSNLFYDVGNLCGS